MKEEINLIQELEADINQASEYGGIPVNLTRTQLRKILAALKVGDELCGALKHSYVYLGTPWREEQVPYGGKIMENWKELTKQL